MYVRIDQEACIGCGVCVEECPSTFEMGSNQKAHVLTEPKGDHDSCATTAASDCPTDAIHVD